MFTEGIGEWWDPGYHLLDGELVGMTFEPRVSGHVVDRYADGRECRWARVLAYEPPHRQQAEALSVVLCGRRSSRASSTSRPLKSSTSARRRTHDMRPMRLSCWPLGLPRGTLAGFVPEVAT